LRTEIERESARLGLVKQQVKAIEAEWRQELADGKQQLVAQLAQLRAIGPKGAWVLVKELFGWRHFANRRELAGCLGLAPTPYDTYVASHASSMPATKTRGNRETETSAVSSR
jgi:transposase